MLPKIFGAKHEAIYSRARVAAEGYEAKLQIPDDDIVASMPPGRVLLPPGLE